MQFERMRVHIDFIDSETFRLTNIFRQKEFLANEDKIIDLRTFKRIHKVGYEPFILRFIKENMRYEFYAIVGDDSQEQVDYTYHGDELTVQLRVPIK